MISVPDLDAALEWGRQIAEITALPCRGVATAQHPGGSASAGEAEPVPMTVPGPDIERVFREEYGRAVSVLVRVFGDIDIAEDAVQDAFARGRAALARRRPAAEPGRLDHHHRPEPGDRPAAPRGVAARPARRRPRCCTPARQQRTPNPPRRGPCATTGSG